MYYFSRDETEISGPGCSRDESECAAFGDDWQSMPMQPQFGGWFNSIAKATGLKKASEKAFSKQAGKPISLTFKNPTAGQIASGVGKSAIMLAPIVATAGGGALLAAPALALAAPVAKSLAPIAKTAGQVASAAKSAGVSVKLTTSGGLSLKTSGGADALVKAANLGDVGAKAQIAALLKPGAVLDANAKLAMANVKAAQARLSVKAPALSLSGAHSLIATASLPGVVGKAALSTIANTHAAAAAGKPGAATGSALLKTAAAQRAPFTAPAFASVALRPASIMAPRPLAVSPLTAGIKPSAATVAAVTAALAATAAAAPKPAAAPKVDPNAPKYLVLDSGQVLADAAAKQRLPGFVVRFNGSVGRQ